MVVFWQQWVVWPCVFDVLKDDHGLCNGFAAMDEHWDFLVNWVGLQKKITFVVSVNLYVLVTNGLQFESPYHPVNERARPKPKHLNISHCCFFPKPLGTL